MDFMHLKDISPDQIILWQWGIFSLNATIVFTWLVMALILVSSWLITRNLRANNRISRWQNLVEVLVEGMRHQIREISQQDSRAHLVFVGTLFIFILVSNLLQVIPGYVAPTASLSTTAGLAICVFVSVPLFGIRSRGFRGYLRQYIRPTVLMLPFNVLGELTRTLALAVRLFGNIMSGTKAAAILLSLTPLLFPVVMHALGLLTGVIQAYIFSVLAMVYIASASRAQAERSQGEGQDNSNEQDNPNESTR
jgi:F-type H+-transporting ATPase subunit a